MPLLVNLRHLEHGDLTLKGELPIAELALDIRDEMIRPEKPMGYDLTIQKLDDDLLVRGQLVLPLVCECVRCLKRLEYRLSLPDWAAHLPLEGEEKVTISNDVVDLTPYIREDIVLAFPQHPLCKPDCKGLENPRKGSAADAQHESELTSSAWSELNKLKF